MYYRYLLLLFFFFGGISASQATTALQYVVVDSLLPPIPASEIVHKFPYYLQEHCPEDGSAEERKSCGDRALGNDLIDAFRLPKAAEGKTINASVYISFIVNLKGKMERIELIGYVGPKNLGLEEAILNAVKTVAENSEWEAGQENGRDILTRMTVPFLIKL
ncbi:energy transducer TonB [Saprospira sp. CCB-QB6]|uniref:energy transducer TonB n=1 Tax=Saprospira sp. CCB-QB6 TaxID=3023936 RepID=UPI00234BBAE6|nr:energy transducer TonB [Saprospira sp. CCB-QB6]WCL81205.1 energy transducer TonB [Saprospira sp. CCB-QB6]